MSFGLSFSWRIERTNKINPTVAITNPVSMPMINVIRIIEYGCVRYPLKELPDIS